MNRGDIKTEVLVRSGKDTTSAWTSEAFVNDWINQAHKWAAGYKPWPFTEGRVSTTFTTGTGDNSDEYQLYNDEYKFKMDSFRMMQIGGKRLEKLNFEDYLAFREDNPSDPGRYFSDFGRTVYINPSIDLGGTLTAWGQYQPSTIPDGDDNDALDTVFTNNGDEGNLAIVEKVMSYIASRDGKIGEATGHEQNARLMLDELWKRITDEQYAYKPSPKSEGQWKRFDIVNGTTEDDLNTNRF